MRELQEKQYELADVAFGLNLPVAVESAGWVPGSAEQINQDVNLPGSDGVRFGKDYRGSSTWAFNLFTDADDEQSAWESVAELATVWDNPVRKKSEVVLPLRYRVAGETHRVYGRPRRFTPVPTNTNMSGRIDIVADFTTVDHRVYSDSLSYETVTIGQPADPNAGIVVPFIPPFTTIPPSIPRQADIIVGGRVPTPVTIKFNGPVANASVQIGSWKAALRDPVTAENPVTIDARPWVRSATKLSGGTVRVNPRVTRISQMFLSPGTHRIIFLGTDPTGQASVTVSWRDAITSPR